MGHIRISPKEGFIWSDVTSAGGHGPVDCIDGSGKGIGPKEVRGISIFKQGASLIQNPPVRSLSNSVLFRSVQDGELHRYPILSTVGFEGGIDIKNTEVMILPKRGHVHWTTNVRV